MGKTYRAAIIGVGAIADIHAMAMGDLENVDLVAGSCRTEDKGRAFAERFDCRWHRDYEELLDQARPDFVTIATPSGFHLEPLEACARRGIHVLCEKPLEITVARVDRMIRAARESGIRLGGIFPQRFNPVLREVHGAASQGRFGDLGGGQRLRALVARRCLLRARSLAGDAGAGRRRRHDEPVHSRRRRGPVAGLRRHSRICRRRRQSGSRDLRLHRQAGSRPGPDRGGGHGGGRHAPSRRVAGPVAGGHVHVPRFPEAASVGGEGRDRGSAGGRARHLGLQPGAGRGRRCAPAFFSGNPAAAGGAADPMAIDYSLHTGNIRGFVNWLAGDENFMLDGPESRKAVAIIEAIYESARTGRVATVRGLKRIPPVPDESGRPQGAPRRFSQDQALNDSTARSSPLM